MKPIKEITQLGYIGIHATKLESWREYATNFLGMQLIETGPEGLALRMDERKQRILIQAANQDGIGLIGLEVNSAASLEHQLEIIESHGIAVHWGTATECQTRHVETLAWFQDPDGHRLELYYGPEIADDSFKPARPMGGFRTGALGFGHVALQTANFDAMEDFYRKVLSFRLSDFVEAKPFRASFMHINPRHHSLAIIEHHRSQAHHIMVEYNYMDDVGRMYDMVLEQPDSIAVTLGRHSNDHMFSFYSTTPSGFMLEAGWAGRLIDQGNWTPEALYGPSIWGHERSWLPEEGKIAAREARTRAAQDGVLEPTEVAASPGFRNPDKQL